MKAWWNLTWEGQIAQSKHCFVGSIIIAVIFAGLFILSEYNARVILERCTATTTGEVISVHSATRRNPQSTLLAHFKVKGVMYSAEGRYKSGYSSFDTLSRKPVIIHYDPDDPTVAYAADAPETTLGWLWLIVAVIFAAGAPLFLVQAKHIQEHGPVMQAKPFTLMRNSESEEDE